MSGFRYSKVRPETIIASLISLEVKYGIHVIYTHQRTDIAQRYVRKLLSKLHEYCERGLIKADA
jgi:ERCC4-type nuclease